MTNAKIYINGKDVVVTSIKLFYDFTNPESIPTAEISRYYDKGGVMVL